MATFKPVIFRSKNDTHNKVDGTTNIKIRIYHNGDSQYIQTDYYVAPDAMSKSGEILDTWPDSDSLNYELGRIVQQYRKAVLQLGSNKLTRISCNSLKNYLVKFVDPKSECIDFVGFSREIIENTDKKKTANWYADSLNALIWFYKTERIDISDIISSRLNEMVKQLRRKGPGGKPLEPGSINNYLRGIRALFNKCKLEYNDDDLGIIKIPHDPFKKVKFPKYRRRRKNIGIVELQQIKNGKYDTFRMNLARDVFFMQFYLMGINIVDLYKLEPPVSGRVEYERSKTDTDNNEDAILLSIKVQPELEVLFNKYSSEGFLSDIKNRYSDVEYFNKAVNVGLKAICEELQIIKVTSNWSRHSWASIARNKAGASKADVDFCLGHVSHEYKMADIYIETDYGICDDMNRQVIDLLK